MNLKKLIKKEFLSNNDPFLFFSLASVYKTIIENNILVFNKFVREYKYKTLKAKFYPNELLFSIYDEFLNDIREKKLASKPPSNFKFSYFLHLTKIDNKFVLSIYINTFVPSFIENVFLEYSNRSKNLSEDFKKSQEFIDFIRKYVVFYRIYDEIFENQKKITIKKFLDRTKKLGLRNNFVNKLLEILNSDKIILLENDEIIMLKKIENFSEVTLR